MFNVQCLSKYHLKVKRCHEPFDAIRKFHACFLVAHLVVFVHAFSYISFSTVVSGQRRLIIFTAQRVQVFILIPIAACVGVTCELRRLHAAVSSHYVADVGVPQSIQRKRTRWLWYQCSRTQTAFACGLFDVDL